MTRTWPADWELRKHGAGCWFCGNDLGEPFYAGHVGHAHLERQAVARGHAVVVFRDRHVADFTSLTSSDVSAYWRDIHIVAQMIEQVFAPCHMNYLLLGNSVPHLHVHLVPRYLDDPFPGAPLPWEPKPIAQPEYDRQVQLLTDIANGRGLMGISREQTGGFAIRRAARGDVDGIALAHRDSIQSIGPLFYTPDVVELWQEAITGELYLKAMDAGEVFFIAVCDGGIEGSVLGFASDYCIEDRRHGTSVYVRGDWARRGAGSALLAQAAAEAVSKGAASIEIEASLAGVAFYKANGFVEVGRGETRLTTGRVMACVFMRKELLGRS